MTPRTMSERAALLVRSLADFVRRSEVHIRLKRRMCRAARTAFVLLRDADRRAYSNRAALRDMRAFCKALHEVLPPRDA